MDLVHDLGAHTGFSLREVEARALKGFTDMTRVFEVERSPVA